MNDKLQVFSYNDNEVSFKTGDNVMVNATEMAKPFGDSKSPKFWLNNQHTNELLNELSKVRNLTLADLVQVTKGGNKPGTWMHEDVAIEFARWLSPAFAIWCNDRIKELLRTGITATRPTIEKIIEDPDYGISLLLELKKEREEKAELERKNEEQSAKIEKDAPKVEYYDKTMSSASTYTTTQIAKDFGWGAVTLNKKLKEMGVQYKQNGQWLLYSNHSGKGYTRSITRSFNLPDGTVGSQAQTMWTERGREFIHSLFKDKVKLVK